MSSACIFGCTLCLLPGGGAFTCLAHVRPREQGRCGRWRQAGSTICFPFLLLNNLPPGGQHCPVVSITVHASTDHLAFVSTYCLVPSRDAEHLVEDTVTVGNVVPGPDWLLWLPVRCLWTYLQESKPIMLCTHCGKTKKTHTLLPPAPCNVRNTGITGWC